MAESLGLNQCVWGVVVSLTLIVSGVGVAQIPSTEDVLNELRTMRERINELEDTVKAQQAEIEALKSQEAPAAVSPSTESSPESEPDEPLESRLSRFKTELIDTLAGEASPLEISGFFDVTAQTANERDNPFELGALELDLEYPFNDHYTVSSALVWEGDAAEVAVAVVDYHWFNDDVPARGRIFDEPGFHLQAGRFDVPFGIDYQFFAAPDRPNITAPLTTERIQLGGFGSDGVRLYGTWKTFDYALYVIDSLYGDNGASVGGRIGFFPSRDPYRLHKFGGTRTLELGLSYVQDIDRHGDARDRVYGADLTFNYEMFSLTAEWMKRDSDINVWGWEPNLETFVNFGKRDEAGFHVSLVTDLEKILDRPLSVFCRFDTWDPDYRYLLDDEDNSLFYRVKNTKRLTFGLGYNLTESIRLKLEYYDFLGNGTSEPAFDDRGVILQLVAGF